MSKFVYGETTFEVEAREMGNGVLNIAFLDQDDFTLVMNWVQNADLSHLVFENDTNDDEYEAKPDVYDGYTVFDAIVMMNATDHDFWEGMRLVVALKKPLEE